MIKIFQLLKRDLTPLLLSVFFLFAVFNPIFKKYDYGAGFPLLMLLAVILLIIGIRRFDRPRERVFGEKLFLMIFGAAVVLSFVFSQTKNIGLSETMAFLLTIPLYTLFAYQKNEWMERFLKVILFSTLIATFLAFVLYFYRAEPRMMGPFFNIHYHSHVWPNAFALFLLMTWPLFIIFRCKKAPWKMAILTSFVLSALLLTYSRGAIIAFGGQTVLLFIYFIKRYKFRAISIAFLVGILTFSLFFAATNLKNLEHEAIQIDEKISFDNGEALTSKQERLDFFKGSYEMAMEKPLLGYGPSSFRQVYNQKQTTLLGNADHPHNFFLKIGAENGLIALGSFAIFLIIVFFTTVGRFRKLNQARKDTTFVLGVAVAGAFAHNLIDYNLNFTANLFLLVILVAFIRSIVAERVFKNRKALIAILISLVLSVLAIFEGGIIALSETPPDNSELADSLFPRDYLRDQAMEELAMDNFLEASVLVDAHLELNSYDSEAFYTKAMILCDEDNPKMELKQCRYNLEQAINLNPKNEFKYYRDYLEVSSALGNGEKVRIPADLVGLLKEYGYFVQENIHFTAYTENVEMAAETIDLLTPLLDSETSGELEELRVNMLKMATEHRNNKTF